MRLFQHPLVRGGLAVAAGVALAEFALLFAPEAWAAVTLPIPLTPIIINLGELPQWIIAVAGGMGLWKSWRAEQQARRAAHVATAASVQIEKSAAQIDLIHKETNSMRAQLEAATIAKGVLAGREEKTQEIAAEASAAEKEGGHK